VNAGVVVPFATVIIPPVKLTLVTDPEPLLLNVVQSAALKAPRLVAEAVGTFSVITGVVVPLATVEVRSVPVVPKVSAATEVTVPPEPVADSVPAAKLTPVPIVTLLKPPVPLPYKIDVPLVAGALPLKVFQSVDVK